MGHLGRMRAKPQKDYADFVLGLVGFTSYVNGWSQNLLVEQVVEKGILNRGNKGIISCQSWVTDEIYEKLVGFWRRKNSILERGSEMKRRWKRLV